MSADDTGRGVQQTVLKGTALSGILMMGLTSVLVNLAFGPSQLR